MALLAPGLVATPEPQGAERMVPRWGRFEHEFTARRDLGLPPAVTLRCAFSGPGDARRTVDAFWDGGRTFRVRFQPDAIGRWTFRSEAAPAAGGRALDGGAVDGLDGVEGAFECVAPRADGGRFARHGAVRVAAEGHHFEHADGTPFFWLADTAWNGALKASAADWERYLADRSAKGFTAVQFVTTQWRTAYTDAAGEVAYTGFESITINPEFYQRLDARIAAVNASGLLAVPVLLWTLGERAHSPGQLPESEAIRLARYQVARYGAHHVAWFLPGDGRYFEDNAERWKRIGRAVFDTPGHAPVFLHPQGMQWPFEAFLDEHWVSAFGYQSGHGDDERTLRWIFAGPPATQWRREPHRPVLNLEPPYEDHIAYQSKEPHSAYNVRRASYWSLLNAPTAGVSYGAHGVWSWEESPAEPLNHKGTGTARPWHEAMALPGSVQLAHLAALFGSLEWWRLRPDAELVTSHAEPDDVTRHVAASRTARGDQALVYLPRGGSVTVARERLEGTPEARWFDPRAGAYRDATAVEGSTYRAPDEQDWVLVLR